MAITITKAYVKTFEDNVRFLAQQSVARLRPFVTEKVKGSSSDAFPRVGPQSMAAKAAARTATPTNDTVYSNRVATPATYHAADSVEPEDAPQMLIDPQSTVAQALAMAAKRQIDDIVITAAGAAAPDETGATTAFPAGQVIGDGTGAFDFAFITKISEKFLLNDIDPSESKVMVISPNCAKKLLAMTQYTSADYVNVKALATSGFLDSWMGYGWVVSTRLPNPAGAQRFIYAFTKRAIGLLVVKDIWARVQEDPSLSFATRIYTALTMGAVRVEDEHIVRGHVLES